MKKYWLVSGLLMLIIQSACGAAPNAAPTELHLSATQPLPSPTLLPTESTQGLEPSLNPEEQTLLPVELYYLAQDANGLYQIFHMNKDGITIEQDTFETADVSGFDVSPLDGSLALVVQNTLFTQNNDGSERITILASPLPENEADRKVRAILNPRWSQDGKALAFSYEGLNIYHTHTGIATKLLDHEIIGSGQLLWTTYIPHSFSPDSKKLLVDISKYESSNTGIYDLATGEFSSISENILAGMKNWSSDSSAVFIAENATSEYSTGCLWRLNASNGDVAILFISGGWEESPSYLANCPYLGPDGKLYFFFFKDPNQYVSRSPLKLIRTNADGVTGFEELLPNPFEPRECLWSQNADLVVITQSNEQGNRPAMLLSINRNPTVQLLPDARELRWGP